MKTRHVLLSAAIACCLVIPSFAVVETASIDAAGKEYDKRFEDAREAGDRPGQADMGDYVDAAFAKIPLDQLTLDQVQHAFSVAPFNLSFKAKAAADAYLTKLSAGTDADAARAAILRLQLLNALTKPEDRVGLIKTVLAHPAIKAAITKGYGATLFNTISPLSADDLKAIHDPLMALKDAVTPDAPVEFFDQAGRYALAIGHTLTQEDVRTFSPLREALAAAAGAKLNAETKLSTADHDRLQNAYDQLKGAFARGELVGYPAPEIHFDAFFDPADPTHVVKSLSDLKGKVVVLDFWATWCGPCVASFPNVKAVQHYYRGYDVVVVGVTSIQGFVISKGERVDTAGDPVKERALIPDFMKEKDMTWDVAVSAERVFNPDYGVNGIPDMIIIDTKGIVRYASLHPAAAADGKSSPLDDKVSKIDKLLGDGGKILPAQLMMSKPKAPAATAPAPEKVGP